MPLSATSSPCVATARAVGDKRNLLSEPARSVLCVGKTPQVSEVLTVPPGGRADREDGGVDLVGAGGSNPVRAGARRPFRFARGISEGERPPTSRM